MRKSALFIGNGLNRAMDNKAWIDMIEEMRKKYDVEGTSKYTNLPLEFERIYLEARKNGKVENTYNLKKDIVYFLPEVSDFTLHKKFMALPIEDILTTNYDYYLEKAMISEFQRKNYNSHTKEIKHSLFRRIEVNNKTIWHIHGEAHCPASICLGYDQYCTYLANVIDLLTHPKPDFCKKPYLRHFLETGEVYRETWLTKIFTHDCFILGLTMSFLETELWWILSYRMRFMLENPQYGLSNRIHYFYPVYEGACNDEQLLLLESMGVELHPIPNPIKNWTKMYENILTEIEKIMNYISLS